MRILVANLVFILAILPSFIDTAVVPPARQSTRRATRRQNAGDLSSLDDDRILQPFVTSCSLLSGGQAHECFCYTSPGGKCAYDEATGRCGTLTEFGIDELKLGSQKRRPVVVYEGILESPSCSALFSRSFDIVRRSGQVYSHIAQNMTTLSTDQNIVRNSAAATVAPHLLVTEGNVRGWMFGDSLDVTKWMIELLVQAREEVLFMTLGWTPDTQMADEMLDGFRRLDSEAKKRRHRVRVKIVWTASLASRLSRADLEMLGLHSSQYEFLDISVQPFRRGLLGVLHSKMLIIDRNEVVVNSQNVQDKLWLQMGIHMTGDIVHSLIAHFFHHYQGDAIDGTISGIGKHLSRTWLSQKMVKSLVEPEFYPWYSPSPLKTIPTEVHNSGSSLVNLPSPVNASMALAARYGHGSFKDDTKLTPQEIAWTTAFNTAQEEIFILTPNFNAKRAIDDALAALQRGIRLTIVTNYKFNDKRESLMQGGPNKCALRKLRRKARNLGIDLKNLTFCWYTPANGWTPGSESPVSHIKYMLVDNRVLIFGSGNMDTQSWAHSVEVNVVIDSESIAPRVQASLSSVISMQRCFSL